MITINALGQVHALAVYKNKPALVREITAGKIVLALEDGGQLKVREKDIEIIHPGPVQNFNWMTETSAAPDSVWESWELLLTGDTPVSLKELAELVYGGYTPAAAWGVFSLLLDGLYFTGTINAINPRPPDQVSADENKRAEKQRAGEERELFLERLRKRRPNLTDEHADNVPDDRRFIQDVESLAFGKSVKSRTMKDIGLGETPEEAHALLLESGFWTEQTNPHPGRFGVSLSPPQHRPEPPPPESRRDLTHLAAFAVDSPWSHDPDDAVSLESENGKQILYVHIADPAASIGMDSEVERESRDRGATLYLPEGCFRMIAEEALPLFALGLAETSPALTFKITLNENGSLAETEIFPSTVSVTRLTYEETDKIIDNNTNAVLCALNVLAERNTRRRVAAGAVNIDLPETHISAYQGQVSIELIKPYRSADMVRECMLLAGEGTGIWALQRNVPFPYIQQETGDFPNAVLPGTAGSYQLRRCMRPRVLSIKPGPHGGLGLDTYTQVTSPLRRYTDLLSHIQIRAFLRGELPLAADELSVRIMAGEAAARAVSQAERASRAHWTMVYLSGKKDSSSRDGAPSLDGAVWDAVALEKKGGRWTVIIPALALETQVALRKEAAPNDPVKLVLKSVNIPRGEAVFVAEEHI